MSTKARVVMILQARVGSTRLSGKFMMDLAGASLVGRIIERVRDAERLTRSCQDETL